MKTMDLVASLRDRIESEIAEGRLVPGSLLDEKELAQTFGTSRTPIREAIQQLCALGLVHRVPREGAYVTKLTSRELLELLELLAYQEGLCAMLAARRQTESEQQEMKHWLEQCEKAATSLDKEAYAHANTQFHEILYTSCRNSQLTDLVRWLRRRSYLYRHNNFHQRGRMAESASDHRKIFNAIASHDESAAFQAAVDHIAVAGKSFAEFLMSLPDEFIADQVSPSP